MRRWSELFAMAGLLLVAAFYVFAIWMLVAKHLGASVAQ
jgi:hypothetical protein